MLSLQALLLNFIFTCISKINLSHTSDYVAERKRNERTSPKAPKGVSVSQIDLDGIYAEKIEKEGNKDRLILYIHGGGFCTGSAKERRGLCQYIANNYGYNCIANDYRLSPENHWPAHLNDCKEVYLSLLKNGYEAKKIIFMGESAGGTLVLSLALQLKDEGIPLPAAIVAFSSCTNQAEGFPSHQYNSKSDKMLGDSINDTNKYKAVFGIYQPDIEKMRNPLISPYYGNYEGLPPIFLAASDTEVLYDDTRKLYDKLKEQNHTVELDIKHKLCHAYPIFYQLRESKDTLNKVFAFLSNC